MLYCRRCKVSVAGNKRCCPLCQGKLMGKAEPETEVFPEIAPEKYSRSFALRLVSFISITIIVILFALNLIFANGVWWSLMSAAAIGCLWFTVSVGIIQRKNVFKNITFQLFIISAIAVLWDLCTTWRGWSIDYVIPISCIVSMLSMVILSKIMKIPPSEHIIYLTLDGIYGIVPIVFIFTGVLNTVIPCVVCVACSIISVAALLLFEGKNMLYEATRRFHL